MDPAARTLPRRRIAALVAIGVVVAGVVIGLAALATDDGGEPSAAATSAAVAEPLPGRPSIVLPPVAGQPTDPAERLVWARERAEREPSADAALRIASAQLSLGEVGAARRTLGDVDGPAADVARALAAYEPAQPAAAVRQLGALVVERSDDAFARFSYGVALLWSGERAAGDTELRTVRDAAPESFYGTAADDLLHPAMAPGYPPFIAASAGDEDRLPALRRAAQAAPDDAGAQVAYAAALVNAGQRAEAITAFDAALAADPGLVEAKVGRIVAGFRKDRPDAAFGQMGPLVRDNPADPSPRLHLALMLLWLRDQETARAQFRQVAETAPETRLGVVAEQFLRAL